MLRPRLTLPANTRRELEAVADAINFAQFNSLKIWSTNVVPPKAADGEIRFTDASNWNPGAGAGFYGFHGGAWNFLG